MFQPFDRARSPTFNRTPLDNPQVLSGDFWAELRIFLAVAKSKSLNQASKTLGISQPTVGRSVKRLQDVTGSQLITSSPNGIRLTDKGKELAGTLADLDERLFHLSRRLSKEKHAAEGLVTISATEAMGGFFVVPQINEFNEQFPNVQLHIKNALNMSRFRENQADIAIRFLPCSERNVSSRKLGYVHFIPVATSPYFSKYGVPTVKTLSQHRFVDSEYYSLTDPPWDAWRRLVSAGTVHHLCDNSYSYAVMVKAGLGIGLLGNYILSHPSMMPVDLGVHIKLPIYLHADTTRLTSRPVRVVFDWLTKQFASSHPWFSSRLTMRSYPSLTATLAQVFAGTPLEPFERSPSKPAP